jgi:site-specific DNA-cytosine methylase
MSKAIRESITEAFGFEPVCINSALVSAQNRQRLYWVGRRNEDGTYSKVDVPQPQDRGILLKDILEDGCCVDKDKAYCLKHQAGNARDYFKKPHTQIKFEPVRIPDYGTDKARPINALYPNNCGGFEHRIWSDNPNKQQVDMIAEPVRVGCMPSPDGDVRNSQAFRVYDSEGKSINLSANGGGAGGKTGLYAVPVNTTVDGKAVTLKSQYYKNGMADLLNDTSKGGKYSASGVAEQVSCKTIENAIPDIVDKYGHLPEMFNAYNRAEIKDKAPTLSTGSMQTSSCAVNIFAEIPCYAIPTEWDEEGRPTKARSCADGKIYTVYEVKDGKITIKGKEYPIKLPNGFYIIRKLTVRECMRLQTVPEWYEFPVSDSQAYKMLGNGWTVSVISWLIDCVLK